MSNNVTIPVIYASDNNYSRYMLVSMYSMLDNLSEGYFCEFHLLVSQDFSAENKDMISTCLSGFDNYSLDYIYMDDRFDDLVNPVERLSSAALFRLILPELLPETDRCIYIDCDTLVQGDISRLWNEDISGALVGGVKGHNFALNEKMHKKRLGWPKKKPFIYVNSGVLMFDLDGLRRDDMMTKMLAEIEKNYFYSDQDIINVACAGKVKYVHPRYNIRPYYSGWVTEIPKDSDDGQLIEDALNDPVVYHYATEFKPWQDTEMHFADRWLAYALNDDLAGFFSDVQRIIDDPVMVKYITMARENRVKYLKLKNEKRELKREIKALKKENQSLAEELEAIKADGSNKIVSALKRLVK